MSQSESTCEASLLIDDEGRASFIYDDELAGLLNGQPPGEALGDVRIKRVSYVEPAVPAGGRVWIADLTPVNGPILGPFALRAEALEAERAWLEQRLFGGHAENSNHESHELHE